MPANFVGPSGPAEESGRPESLGDPDVDGQEPEVQRRKALLWLAAALFAVVIGVQVVQGHTDTWMQLAPVALSALGIAAIGNYLFEDDPAARWLVRVTSVLIVVGGVYGILEYLTSDDAGPSSLFIAALLAVTATIMTVGTWRAAPPATAEVPNN